MPMSKVVIRALRRPATSVAGRTSPSDCCNLKVHDQFEFVGHLERQVGGFSSCKMRRRRPPHGDKISARSIPKGIPLACRQAQTKEPKPN
jgi:hypothetical protein